MPRLFVAIDLPESTQQHLLTLHDPNLAARWLPSEQLHLTLAFIGEVSEEEAVALEEALARIQASGFEMSGRGVNVFPGLRSPRIVYAGIEPIAPLKDLQRAVERKIVEVGLPVDEKPFHPHITVARMKYPQPDACRGFVRAHQDFLIEPVPVTAFYLYESLLRPQGAIYRKRKAFPVGNLSAA